MNTISFKQVEDALEATYAANAALPYVHADYEAAWAEARVLMRQFYGSQTLAEFAEYIWHDCGEAWTRAKLATWYVSEHQGALVSAAKDVSYSRYEADLAQAWNQVLELAAGLHAADPSRTQQQWYEWAMLQAMHERLTDCNQVVPWASIDLDGAI